MSEYTTKEDLRRKILTEEQLRIVETAEIAASQEVESLVEIIDDLCYGLWEEGGY